jgi:hypothetical protein
MLNDQRAADYSCLYGIQLNSPIARDLAKKYGLPHGVYNDNVVKVQVKLRDELYNQYAKKIIDYEKLCCLLNDQRTTDYQYLYSIQLDAPTSYDIAKKYSLRHGVYNENVVKVQVKLRDELYNDYLT